jgi:hypothetical protein
MIRIIKMSGKFYGKNIDLYSPSEWGDIQQFTGEGTPCILVEDLEDAADLLDISPEEIEVVN